MLQGQQSRQERPGDEIPKYLEQGGQSERLLEAEDSGVEILKQTRARVQLNTLRGFDPLACAGH